MKYIIEFNGEEPTTAIEEVLDSEFGRNCSCGYVESYEPIIRKYAKTLFPNDEKMQEGYVLGWMSAINPTSIPENCYD